jgi:uncharacterized protein YndB with AHSA1/START domain
VSCNVKEGETTMSESKEAVRLTHRFSASAERVYDAFLDAEEARKFLFATSTGAIVRCEIDARVGGSFVIVDRRDGEDVLHTGTYQELERPRRIVFTLSVPKYSSHASKVTLVLEPLDKGCELTLTQEAKRERADTRQSASEGWLGILEVAAEVLVDEAPTCGIGVAQHAKIPEKIGVMFEGLAETLELHRAMLKRKDPNARREDDVYAELAARWRNIAQKVRESAAQMAAQRELPMGTHDESAWSDENLRAFEKFVNAEKQALGLLRVAAERDGKMLAAMKQPR